ncbi:U3 small nucleolar RNA-associated protein [Gnomoniopsis smithogilvyi]|uniref:U3 small nucleolar RNA-associated protein n=1 Tax=Gnomoniopsis smithogilvyi TaxID=1191159 RepID=A0A9W9CY33_9PEZI|nr:U3 small nucleolar RNA-associated protein [Gnomoniopsis smithogilvyi]
MDIHRCRFVPFPASPINTIAFSHPLLDTKRPARLAIGRANGDIEVWNPLNGNWFQETIIHGGRDRSVDSLVWVTGDDETLPDGSVMLGRSRLFSIGYTTTVTEWDLEKGRARKHASGQHGDIWCLGAQPAPSKGPANGVATAAQPQRLVAGTIDGSIVLYSIDDDDLQFQRVLVKTAKQNIKMVSIAFQSRQVAVVGCSDSSIRVYDLRRGELLRKMTLGKDLIGGSKDIIVWSVKCLKNGDIVSGDSTGQIVIWDGKTYTQAQRIQGHKQDVLSLATSADGGSIISGGMDRRTSLYRPMARDSSRWQRVWHRKYHDHDVKAIASFEGQGMSVVVTGGPDATPVVTPLRQAGVENHRTLSHLPHSIPIQSAPQARYIIGWWEREVHVWKLRHPMKDLLDSEDVEQGIEGNRKLLARILIKGESNITSAAISKDGSVIVVATASAIKAFHLTPIENSKEELKIGQIEVPTSVGKDGSTLVQISPNGQWLSWIQDGIKVLTTRIIRNDSSSDPQIIIHPRPSKLTRLRRDIPKHVRLGGLGSYDRRITHIVFSPGSDILATADLAGYVDTWVLRDGSLQNGTSSSENDDASSSASSDADSDDENDTQAGPRWLRNPKAALFPKLSHAPVVLSFSEDALGPSLRGEGGATDEPILLAVTAASRIYTFHPLEGALTRWSRRNGVWKLPDEIRATRDLIKGAVWQGSRIWMYGASFLFMLDISQDYAEGEAAAADESTKHKRSRKRKRGLDTGAGSKMDKGEALAPQHVRVALAQDGKVGEWVDVQMADADQAESQLDDDDEDDSGDEGGELQKLRDREQSAATAQKNGGSETAGDEGSSTTRRNWWHTYKYRPILGMVPLSTASEGVQQANGVVNGKGKGMSSRKTTALEVALVERPKWDVDMPARYVED